MWMQSQTLGVECGQMPTKMYLVNDDQPWQFPARVATIVRDDVRVGDQSGVVVTIDPPIENAAGGSLATAILVPRHRNVSIEDLRRGATLRPVSVFVCRFKGEPNELDSLLTKNDVQISF